MADNGRSQESLSLMAEVARTTERREFLRKAGLVGIPVVLATVRPRSLWAQVPRETQSCIASAGTSGCDQRFRREHGLLGGH
jgi:hypothetical protein